jgi:hypothetical protein
MMNIQFLIIILILSLLGGTKSTRTGIEKTSIQSNPDQLVANPADFTAHSSGAVMSTIGGVSGVAPTIHGLSGKAPLMETQIKTEIHDSKSVLVSEGILLFSYLLMRF